MPTRRNGKICYIEIPAVDISLSANFYKTVFGWSLREDGPDNISFDDTIGEVSGMWVKGRKPATEPGIMVSIMVDDIFTSMKSITEQGGKILQPPGDGGEKFAIFSDPAGNLFCIYQSSR